MPTGHWNFPTPKPWCCRKHEADPWVNPRREIPTNQGHHRDTGDAMENAHLIWRIILQKRLMEHGHWHSHWLFGILGMPFRLSESVIEIGWSCNFPIPKGVCVCLVTKIVIGQHTPKVQGPGIGPHKEKGACKGPFSNTYLSLRWLEKVTSKTITFNEFQKTSHKLKCREYVRVNSIYK